ncbi:MAG: hypothetical protein NZ853_06715 [Leptospiraceae bacterium]|nr:hypothetical protein [Leptospiraceae bacterium]MDW7975875.1 hypothetical protein [Leptospiraceae bacterium]
MKSKKRYLIILILSFSFNLYPQKNPRIEIDIQFSSDYIWRGHNFYRDYNIQKKESYKSINGAWSFQPSITWYTPLNGLYVNLFSSFALVGQNDKDIDQRLQTNPRMPFIKNRTSLLDYIFDSSLNIIDDLQNTLPNSNFILDYENLPNFYREPVGLRRFNELDITIGYDSENKMGKIGFGIMHFKYASPLSVGIPYGTEIFLTYSFPNLEGIELGIHEDIVVNTIYYSISFDNGFYITNELFSEYEIQFGYYVLHEIQGISDITFTYRFVHDSGFYLGFNATYTPDRTFQDYFFGSGDPLDTEFDPNQQKVMNAVYKTDLPIEINGFSSIYDGKVADPSKTTGPINEYINKKINEDIANLFGIPYKYVPRQKLPNSYYWINFGYRYAFE